MVTAVRDTAPTMKVIRDVLLRVQGDKPRHARPEAH